MIKKVYVFFNTADQDAWYTRWIDKAKSHCFSHEHQLLAGYDCFIKIENLFNYIETEVFFGTEADLKDKYPGSLCVKVIMDVNPRKRMFNFIPMTCVSLVKKQLGINKPFIITPKQLHNYLIKLGGKEI